MGPSSLARCAAISLLLIPFVPLTASDAPEQLLPSPAFVDQVLDQLSHISGMRLRHPVRFTSISRPDTARYLEARTRQSTRPEELEKQQAALELLGLIPAGFDLRKLTVDLMTEQAAAFYDYKKRALFLSDWAPGGMRDTAIIHELGHALADQNFSLAHYSKAADFRYESALARQAVIEGQASYLMFAYAALPTGKPAPEVHPDISSFDRAVAPTNGQYPVFDRAPLYVRMGLIFPYTWGLAFQSALVDRLGQNGFTAPFRHPPLSSQQILHPNLYFTGKQPRRCQLPKPSSGYRVIYAGDVGELDHRVLLQQYVSLEEARSLSPEWRGGSFQIIQNKKSGARMLVYASEWSDENSAARFLKDYRLCIQGKSHGIRADRDTSTELSGLDDRGYFRVEQHGALIDAVEASPAPLGPT